MEFQYNTLNKNTLTILKLVNSHCKELNIFSIDIDLNGKINVLGHYHNRTASKLLRKKFKAKVSENGFVKFQRNILTITLT
jgi:hypothetical protein